jgi:hypothetical protein
MPESADAEASNAHAIAALAEETLQPQPVVKQIFDEQYALLKATARITDYLVLFATRRTKNALIKKGASK